METRIVEAKSILSKSNLPVCDYSANPYVGCSHACRYCYASFMKRFSGHDEPWGRFVDVKRWKPLKNTRKYNGKQVFVGSVCDPYMPEEAEYGRTRALLEELVGSGMEVSLQTKSDLVLRDIDLISQLPGARVGFSINTLDEGFRSDMDAAVPVARRLAAMKALHDAGIPTTCFISPIFPGITDVPAIIEAARDRCNLVWLENLNLRGGYKADILGYIAEKRPELMPLYDAVYQKGDRTYWRELDAEVRAYAEREGLEYVRDDDTVRSPFDAPPVIVNYFFHEEIKKSAKKEGGHA
ncbi:radical SAM protein [Gordonibacter sp. An232A]|nr:radical SAM protein [Gordonibacter sp. An232A]